MPRQNHRPAPFHFNFSDIGLRYERNPKYRNYVKSKRKESLKSRRINRRKVR